MTVDRDSSLQSLFDVAKKDLTGEAFVAELMSRIDTQRRRVIIVWICISLVFASGVLMFVAPLLDAVHLAIQVLPESLVDLNDRWLAQLLAPVNSIMGLLALGLLGLRMAYRKIFS